MILHIDRFEFEGPYLEPEELTDIEGVYVVFCFMSNMLHRLASGECLQLQTSCRQILHSCVEQGACREGGVPVILVHTMEDSSKVERLDVLAAVRKKLTSADAERKPCRILENTTRSPSVSPRTAETRIVNMNPSGS